MHWSHNSYRGYRESFDVIIIIKLRFEGRIVSIFVTNILRLESQHYDKIPMQITDMNSFATHEI